MSSQPNIRKLGLMGTTALTRPASALGAMALMLGSSGAYAIDANTLPTGGTVVGGAASISQGGTRLDVNQSTNRTVIDWRNFDIGGNAHVNFDQPNSGSIAVNRINASTNPTQINGRLTANGNVWVLNPNGVMFGAGARVDVSGLVASTGNINVGQFQAGSMRIDFTGGAGGSVINEGQITVSQGGLAAFVAPHVRNSGVIRARLGKVTLAAGETFTLDLAGDQLVEIGLGSNNATAEQFGQIIAEGGVINISAKAAGTLIDSLVNVTGYTSAASASIVGGEIILSGGIVHVASTLDVSGATGGGSINITGSIITTTVSAVFTADATDQGDGGSIVAYADIAGDYDGQFSARGGANGGDGGFVETSGKAVSLDAALRVDTSAANGETGSWSIDPDDFVVGVGEAAAIVASLDTTNTMIEANNSITVNSEIDSSAQANSNQLALNDENTDNNLTITLNAEINLGTNQTLTGEGTVVNVNSGTSIQNGVDVAANDATVNVGVGIYDAGTAISSAKTGLTIDGGGVARVDVANTETGFAVAGDGTTISGFEIAGPVDDDFRDIDWSDPAFSSSFGITVNAQNVSITGNSIHDIRSGVSFAVGSEATVTGNIIDNTKGSFLVRSDDITMTGNSIGATGSEWDIVFFGVTDGAYATSPNVDDKQYGAAIMALSSDNGGMRILDRRYGSNGLLGSTPQFGNRSHIEVSAGSSFTAADDFGFGNGLGNQRQALGSIADGIDAVVNGGFVNVSAGTYAEDVVINKTVTLTGAQAGVDARTRSGASESIVDGAFQLLADADNVTIDGFSILDGSNIGGANVGIFVGNGASGTTIQNTIFTRSGVVDGDSFRGVLSTSNGGNTGLTVTQNSFSGWATGVFLNPGAAGADIIDNDFDGNFVGMSIDGPDNTQVTGNSFTNNVFEGLGIGPGATPPALTLETNTFDANTTHIAVYTDVDVDATTNAFDGTDAGDMTIAELFALEDKIGHGIDSGFSGFVTTRAGNVFVTENSGSIQRGIDAADTGETVNVANGTYASSTRLNIYNSLTLSGESESGTLIDQRGVSGTYGMLVSANDVTLQDFTFYGPDGSSGSHYGIKVSPGGAPSARLTNFRIENVTSRGAGRAELDLNGVDGAIITNFTADGRRVDDDSETAGAGIQLTDTANVTLTGVTTLGNAWGGVALYQANRDYDQQTANINIDAALNTFNEINGLFAQDESDTNDFGAVNLTGYTHIVENEDFRPDGEGFTFFRTSQQDAIDYAMSLASAASSYIEGWTGTGIDGVFTVGTATGGDAMSIGSAVQAADAGNTINVLAGAYDAFSTLNGAEDLVIQTTEGAIIDGSSFSAPGRLVNLYADGTTLSGFTINGPGAGAGTVVGVSIVGEGITVQNNTISDVLTGIQTNTAIAVGNATITGNTVTSNHGISLQNTGNVVTGNTFNAAVEGLGILSGANTLTDNTFNIATGGEALALYVGALSSDLTTERNTVNVGEGVTVQNAADLAGTAGTLALREGTYNENVTVDQQLNLSFENVAIDGLTLNGAGSTVSGTVSSSVNGFTFNIPLLLAGNTSLTTTGAATVTVGAIDGTTAGGQTLTINSEAPLSLGSLGAATRLGATIIGGAGAKTLLGDTFNANSLRFDGGVTVTQALTSFDTTISDAQAGNIIFTGDLFGTTDGDQAVSFIAGNGSGGAGKNGDITLQNVGTKAVQLDSMTVSGDDFEAATVWIATNYTALLTGDQFFSDETLNVGGNASSSVGGNATGPIVAGGNVTVNAGGAISGNVSGTNVALTGQSVSGNVTATGTGTITAPTVNVDISGGTFDINAGSGTVTGNPTGLNTSGSGTVKVNGQTVVGSSDANFNQIVVEGFVLPEGAFISSTGEIVLPQGLSIGLISPAAGGEGGSEPKVVFVRSVQRLGALLAEGYTAIVIDLNDGFDDTEQELAMVQ